MADEEKELKEEDEYEAEEAEDFEEQEFKDEYADKQHESTAPSKTFKDELDEFVPPLQEEKEIQVKKKAAGKKKR